MKTVEADEFVGDLIADLFSSGHNDAYISARLAEAVIAQREIMTRLIRQLTEHQAIIDAIHTARAAIRKDMRGRRATIAVFPTPGGAA